MSELHKQLVCNYSTFYRMVNAYPTAIQHVGKMHREFEANYGEYINSLPEGARVLDVGCGFGFLLSWLQSKPHLQITGIDACSGQIEQARQWLDSRVELINIDGLEYLQRHSSEFAVIFCMDMLEHIPGEDLLLEYLNAVWKSLKPGGCFINRVPNMSNILGCSVRYMDFTHVHGFTSESMVQVMNIAGFKDVRFPEDKPVSITQRVRFLLVYILHRALYSIMGLGTVKPFQIRLVTVGIKDNSKS